MHSKFARSRSWHRMHKFDNYGMKLPTAYQHNRISSYCPGKRRRSRKYCLAAISVGGALKSVMAGDGLSTAPSTWLTPINFSTRNIRPVVAGDSCRRWLSRPCPQARKGKGCDGNEERCMQASDQS